MCILMPQMSDLDLTDSVKMNVLLCSLTSQTCDALNCMLIVRIYHLCFRLLWVCSDCCPINCYVVSPDVCFTLLHEVNYFIVYFRRFGVSELDTLSGVSCCILYCLLIESCWCMLCLQCLTLSVALTSTSTFRNKRNLRMSSDAF